MNAITLNEMSAIYAAAGVPISAGLPLIQFTDGDGAPRAVGPVVIVGRLWLLNRSAA